MSVSNNQQRKVTTWLFILFLHQSPRLSPYTVQTHPSLSAMTVLYNMRLYSLYLPFLALSLCIPASFPRYPSHTSPPANIYVEREREREKKEEERNSFKHVGINLTYRGPFFPFPPDGLHYFIPLCANARDHTGTDFFPLSMKRIAKSSAIQHHRQSHQHEHWIHMLQQKLLAGELTNFVPQIERRGESQF